MLLFGRLLVLYRPKIIYLVSIALFEIGSLICAVAPSPDVLIFGRAFAGVGAAGLWVAIMSIFARVRLSTTSAFILLFYSLSYEY